MRARVNCGGSSALDGRSSKTTVPVTESTLPLLHLSGSLSSVPEGGGTQYVGYAGRQAVDLSSDWAYEGPNESSPKPNAASLRSSHMMCGDAYFSADVETDGPIPGPYSMLSFAIVYAGSFDGKNFIRPKELDQVFYAEIKPISTEYQQEALDVNKLDRARLSQVGEEPSQAMSRAYDWVRSVAGQRHPVLVAYPVSFDWTWLYWYFVAFCNKGSPFNHSRCFDIKTALAVKTRTAISQSGRSRIPFELRSHQNHTHHAKDDAIEQAEIFANVFEWKG